MAKYKLTENGVLDTETSASIPDASGNRHWQEYQQWLDEGNTPDPMDVLSLDALKATANSRVDMTAEQARLRYITSGDGQAMSYLLKKEEAASYRTEGYPAIGSPIDYPWVKAEMDATGQTGQEAADAILAQRDVWLRAGTEIERERRLGKINIDAAVDETGVNTAKNNATTALEAI